MKLLISKDASYPLKNLVTIEKWEETFDMPGGFKKPKRVTCVASNGLKYMQLVKRGDDPRQDAVIQQVFTFMNDILAQSEVTRKLHLNIRTYRVVPLSPRHGIIEWCDNTMTLHGYLVDKHKMENEREERENVFPARHDIEKCENDDRNSSQSP